MAIRSEEVLNKANTLNTNLENANIPEIQRDISKRVFGILNGTNNISIDSELYASINDVTDKTDITSYIATSRTNLPNNYIPIPYTGRRPYDVPNSVITLAGTRIEDTENAINNMNNAINGLNTLPNQINTLRNRLEENRRILNEIHITQQDGRWRGRTITEINQDITDETSNIDRCNNLLNILTRIQNAEQHAAYSNTAHAQHGYYLGLRNNEVGVFNGNIGGFNGGYTTGIAHYTNNGDFVNRRVEVTRAQTHFNNSIRNLQQELRLSEDITRNENRLPTSTISVPNGFGLFNENDTVINRTNLTNATNTQTQIDNINIYLNQLNALEGQIETLRTRYQDNLNRLNKILALQQLEQKMNTTHPGEMNRRHREFETITGISHTNLWLGEGAPGPYEPYLPNTTIGIGERGTGGNPAREIHLNFVDGPLGNGFNNGARNFTYSLCDETGNPLRNNGGRLEIQQGGQTINIRGITFDNATQRMNIDNIQITPLEGLNFPLNLDLNVRVRIHDNDTGLDIDHHKPIHLEITRPTLVTADREAAYDSLTPPMNERIQAEYSDNYRENLENEVIWKILREGGNESEIDEIYNNELRRKELEDRMRMLLNRSFPAYALALRDLQTGFRTNITTRDDVPNQYLINETTFADYVRNSIPDKLREYTSGRIYEEINGAIRTDILNELINFQTDVANNSVDNLDHLIALNALPNTRPEGHPNNWRQRLTGNKSSKNNYTKFLTGRSAEIMNQELETEKGKIQYSVTVNVTGVNEIVAEIDINGQKHKKKAKNHDELIAGILERSNTKDEEPLNKKLRCNIALSVLKAMVMMSPIALNREIPLTNYENSKGQNLQCDRIKAFIKDDNLKLIGGYVDQATHTRQNLTLFDENQFKNLHNTRTLEIGIRELSTQFTSILNATAQEYNQATNRFIKNRSLRIYNTAQHSRLGFVKRFRGRILHGKTNKDFSFDTSVNEAGKSVNISFKNGKFTISGEFDGKNYSYTSKNLGSILRKKINRKRIFDGVELALIGKVNEEYVKKLRTNNLIETENFAVTDFETNKTGRVYILDQGGDLSYIEIEDRRLNPLEGKDSGCINIDNIHGARNICDEQERKEFFQNPLLAGKLIKAMRRKLAMF